MCTRIFNQFVSNLSPDINSIYPFQHYSCILKNGKPLYKGSNNSRNCFNGNCICYSTHAEMDVLQKVLKGEARTTI